MRKGPSKKVANIEDQVRRFYDVDIWHGITVKEFADSVGYSTHHVNTIARQLGLNGKLPPGLVTAKGAWKYMLNSKAPVCDEWKNFRRFLSDMGKCPFSDSAWVDRIDKKQPFAKGNARWMWSRRNIKTQRLITANGKRMSRSDWAHETGISSTAIKERIRDGWTKGKAATAPSRNATREVVRDAEWYMATWRTVMRDADGDPSVVLSARVYPVQRKK